LKYRRKEGEKMKKLIVLSVPFVLLLFLFGCVQRAGPAEPQPSACRNHTYFPLRLGAHWEYLWESDLQGSISEIHRYDVTELNVDNGTTTEKIVTLAPDIPDQNVEAPFNCFDTGIITPLGIGYMPYDLTRGITWSDPFSTQFGSEQFQAADNLATITVPVGTFEALCIASELTYTSYPKPDSYYPNSKKSCYAEGVGLVYEEYTVIRPRDGDTNNEVLRLVSYTIPAQ
jgi:hypothetical protein